MKLEILGTGCPKCKKLGEVAEAAAQALERPYELVKVTDIEEIMRYGVMMTPALLVDGKVRVVGRVPTLEEAKELLGQG